MELNTHFIDQKRLEIDEAVERATRNNKETITDPKTSALSKAHSTQQLEILQVMRGTKFVEVAADLKVQIHNLQAMRGAVEKYEVKEHQWDMEEVKLVKTRNALMREAVARMKIVQDTMKGMETAMDQSNAVKGEDNRITATEESNGDTVMTKSNRKTATSEGNNNTMVSLYNSSPLPWDTMLTFYLAVIDPDASTATQNQALGIRQQQQGGTTK